VKEPEMKVEQLAAAVLPSTGNATPKPELSTPAPVVVPSPTAPTASVARVAAAPAPVSRTAAPAAPPPTASKSESRFFTVQVGAFASNENAELLVTELKRKFEGVFVDQAPVGRTPYRVRVGRLSTMAAAKQVQSRLMAQGFESFVVTPEMP